MKRLSYFLNLALFLAAAGSTSQAEPAPVPPRPGFTLADLKAQVPQSENGSFLMEVPMILDISTDTEAQGLLEGQAVETTGMVMPETVDNAAGRRLRIIRSEVLCCNTHSRQCSVALEFAGKAPGFMPMSWVTLAGKLSYRQEGEMTVPVILVEKIAPTKKPANAILQ